MRTAETFVRAATNNQLGSLASRLEGRFKTVGVLPGELLSRPEIKQIELWGDDDGNTIFVSEITGEAPPVIITSQSLKPLIEEALKQG